MKLHELLDRLSALSKELGTSLPFCCGGVTRDKYMNRLDNISDVDITTGDKTVQYLADEFGKELEEKYNIFRKTYDDGHSSINIGKFKMDFSSNFIDPSLINSKLSSMQKEMFSRDFTCNALLLSLDLENLEDPTGKGFKDIDNKIIRTCLAPEVTLVSNKNRVIRSIYLACKLGFEIDENIVKYVLSNPESVNISTNKVMNDKLTEAFDKDADKAVYYLDKMKLWNLVPVTENMKPYFMNSIKNKTSSFEIKKEARVNANVIEEELSKFVSSEKNPKFFFSMTEINKIGINPQSKYSTPLGVYCYPLTKEYFDKLIKNKLPFAGDKRYIKVISLSDATFNLTNYSNNDLKKDVKTITTEIQEVSESVIDEAFREARTNDPISKFWNLTRMISANAKKWNFLLRKIGYTNFYDPGTGVIHPWEPAQCVILDPTIIIEVKTLLNPHFSNYSTDDDSGKGNKDYKIVKDKRLDNIGFSRIKSKDIINFLELNKLSSGDLAYNFVTRLLRERTDLSEFVLKYIIDNFKDKIKKYEGNLIAKQEGFTDKIKNILFEPVITKDQDGTSYYRTNGILHREGGPAVIYPDGTQMWYKLGDLHREDGLASILSDGTEAWYYEGKFFGGSWEDYNQEKFEKDLIKNKNLTSKTKEQKKQVLEPELTQGWIEDPDGSKYHYVDNKLHNDNGPAIILQDGTKHWYKNGKRHREDGPAREYADGVKTWWLDDIELTEEEWKEKISELNLKKPKLKNGWETGDDGTKYHYVDNKLHNDDGPAVIYADGIKTWYLNGQAIGSSVEAFTTKKLKEYIDKNVPKTDSSELKQGWIINDGDKLHYLNDQLHNDTGPAVIYDNGNKWWYKHGKIHREDGPAVEYFSGGQAWWYEGFFLGSAMDHDFDKYTQEKFEQWKKDSIKLDKPKTDSSELKQGWIIDDHGDYGDKTHYVHDVIHNDNGPAVIYADGTKYWYKHGKLHREDGPAVEFFTGTKVWYYKGERLGDSWTGYSQEKFQNYLNKIYDDSFNNPDEKSNKNDIKNGWITNFFGDKNHYVNDALHNDNGPAIIFANGNKWWYKHGKSHREDGPARENIDGSKWWYYEGEWLGDSSNGYTQEKFNEFLKNKNSSKTAIELINSLLKKSYFQGGGGVNEPTPKNKKYKSDKKIVDQPRFKEPFYSNYDLYNTPGEHSPGAGYHSMQNYKSISDFLKDRRKKLKDKYKSDDSYVEDDGTISKAAAKANLFYKLAIDFPQDQYIDPNLTGFNTLNPLGMLDKYYPQDDFEGKSPDKLNFGRDYSDELYTTVEHLFDKYLDQDFSLDDLSKQNKHYGLEGPDSLIYEDKWNI